MKAYCLTTGHMLHSVLLCSLLSNPSCFVLLAFAFAFWSLKKNHLSVLFVVFFPLFFHFLFAFFSLFFRIFFVFFSLFVRFFFALFSLFFRFFFAFFFCFFFVFFLGKMRFLTFSKNRRNCRKTRSKKSEKKTKKKAKKKRTKSEKKNEKNAETKTQIFTQSPPPFLLRVPAFPPVDSCFVFSVSCVACFFLAFVLMFRL